MSWKTRAMVETGAEHATASTVLRSARDAPARTAPAANGQTGDQIRLQGLAQEESREQEVDRSRPLGQLGHRQSEYLGLADPAGPAGGPWLDRQANLADGSTGLTKPVE